MVTASVVGERYVYLTRLTGAPEPDEGMPWLRVRWQHELVESNGVRYFNPSGFKRVSLLVKAVGSIRDEVRDDGYVDSYFSLAQAGSLAEQLPLTMAGPPANNLGAFHRLRVDQLAYVSGLPPVGSRKQSVRTLSLIHI